MSSPPSAFSSGLEIPKSKDDLFNDTEVIPTVKFHMKQHEQKHTGFEKSVKELLNWVNKELISYGCAATDLSSFASGELLLALVHRCSPTLFDYKNYSKVDAASVLANTFSMAEELGIPAFLSVNEVIANKDPRALVMYISLFKIKIEDGNKQPIQSIKYDLGNLAQLITDCATTVSNVQDQFQLSCSKLVLSGKPTASNQEELEYYKQRTQIMNEMVNEAFKMIESLEIKNELLYEENRLLNEKLTALRAVIAEEQYQRKKAEEMLTIEQKIMAIGNLLDPEGQTVEYYLKKYQEQNSSEFLNNK